MLIICEHFSFSCDAKIGRKGNFSRWSIFYPCPFMVHNKQIKAANLIFAESALSCFFSKKKNLLPLAGHSLYRRL